MRESNLNKECTCGVCDNCEEEETTQILKEAKENALKQQTIEQAADQYASESSHALYEIKKESFMDGAKSDAARDYWFEQFKNK
jgi:hypothetical protein